MPPSGRLAGRIPPARIAERVGSKVVYAMNRSLRYFARGAKQLAESLAIGGIFTVIIVVAAAIIVLPLWLISSTAPDVYGVLVLAIFIAALVSMAARKISLLKKETPGIRGVWKRVVRPAGSRIVTFCIGAILIYFAIVFFAGARIVFGIGCTAILFAFVVIVKSGRRRER